MSDLFPVQPIIIDDNGVERFRANKVVSYLLEHGGLDLNKLAAAEADLPREDWEQFYQLIGYSVSGAPLSEDTHEAIHIAKMQRLPIRDARIKMLEAKLARIARLAVQIAEEFGAP